MKLVPLAPIALALTLATTTADAGLFSFLRNGTDVNGIELNGVKFQGRLLQGRFVQGMRVQGIRLQGAEATGTTHGQGFDFHAVTPTAIFLPSPK